MCLSIFKHILSGRREMTRGTTPTHEFNTNVDLTDAKIVYITYMQNGETVVEKTIDDAVIDGDKITVSLTEEDTLKFDANSLVEIQLRVGFENGERIASNIMRVRVQKILKDGELA